MSNEVELVGVSATGGPPVGWVHLPLRSGLNVLYGKNGAGKTLTLKAIESVLRRERHPVVRPTKVPSPAEALYVHGGIHLRADLEPRSSSLGDAVARSVMPAGSFPGAVIAGLITKDEIRHQVVQRLVDTAPWAVDAGLVEEVLEGGHWFVCRVGDTDFIYLAHSPGGPLTGTLTYESEMWRVGGVSRQTLYYSYFDDHYDEDRYNALMAEDEPPPEPVLPAAVSGAPPPYALGLGDQEPVSLPVALVGALTLDGGDDGPQEPLVAVATEGLAPLPVGEVILRSFSWPAGSEPPSVTDDEGAPSQQIRELADALSAQAQRTLAALVEDGPDLAIRLGDARAWLRGSTPAWMARRAGRTFGIDQLGDGHRRLAELAISRTTASLRRSSYGLSVTILDEPERALHLSALERLLAGLTELDPCVLVASHSPKLLDAGDNLVHVRQTLDAEVRLSAPVMWADDQLGLDHVAEDLGISRSDLLALTRVFVLVEGPHDQVVLTQLCRDALTETRGRVLHLGGTRDVHHAATSDVLFEATTAKFIFVVDNASASWAKRQYEKAHDGEDLWRNNSRLPNERRALLRLLEAGQREGRLDRIRLQPLAKRDIANYLPASEVVPGFGTWREVDEAFKRHKGGGFEPGDGRKKKAWANAQARQQGLTGRYHTSGLARIAKAIADGELDAEIHKDIQDLREAIRSAGGS